MLSSRLKLTVSHLVISSLAIFLPATLLFSIWYPQNWYPFTGGIRMMALVLLATLIGPVVSLIIYKTNRRLLAMDLAVIAIIQLLTAGIGMHALYQGRAQWVVFVKDDWRILRPIDMQPDQAWRVGDFLSGPRWIGARYADDEVTRAEQETRELVDGVTVESFASSHVALDTVLPNIINTARPLARLTEHNSASAVQAILAEIPEAHGWLPLKGISRDGVVLVDAQGHPLRAVPLAPWEPD